MKKGINHAGNLRDFANTLEFQCTVPLSRTKQLLAAANELERVTTELGLAEDALRKIWWEGNK